MNHHETGGAAALQQLDLKTLAIQVVSRNQCNYKGNSVATQSTSVSCQVSSLKEGNQATLELKRLIYRTSQFYGGDDVQFLDEYVDDILKHNSLDKALACFRDLATQTLSVNNRK